MPVRDAKGQRLDLLTGDLRGEADKKRAFRRGGLGRLVFPETINQLFK